MFIVVREASLADLQLVSSVLTEAASWLEKRGIPLWKAQDVAVERLQKNSAGGLYVLAEVNGQAAGTLRYQLEDPVF